MTSSRRRILQAAAVASGGSLLVGCERSLSGLTRVLGQNVPEHLQVTADATISPEFHLLSRAAFGPWPGDVEHMKKIGCEAWLEEQLKPESINDSLCDLRAQRFDVLRLKASEAYNWKKPALRDAITSHTLLRAIYSKRQLHEVMVEFWTDHFNIDLEKGDCIYFKPADDRDVIRKHALGNFRELLRASATSPAMLVYLDGRSNKITPQKPVPNENYAREIMELHTLGVNGGYSQKDIYEAARCLSGWTVNLRKDKQSLLKQYKQPTRGETFFNVELHDNGAKSVLGHTVPSGGGEADLDRLVEILCQHPSTAKHIATKLCRHFVSDPPPEALISEVARSFAETRGDIKAMLRVIFKSEAFSNTRGVLLKRPFRYVVSSLRATAADTHAHASLIVWLHRMGQSLFQYPTPDGYPDSENPWMGTLLWRWNYSLNLANGNQSMATLDLAQLFRALDPAWSKGTLDQAQTIKLFAHLCGRKPNATELNAVQGLITNEEILGVLLASPAFQRC